MCSVSNIMDYIDQKFAEYDYALENESSPINILLKYDIIHSMLETNKIYQHNFANSIMIEDTQALTSIIPQQKGVDTTNPKPIKKPIRKCSDCNGTEFTEDRSAGHVVCNNCSLVIENIIDQGPEGRNYGADDKKNDGNNRCTGMSNYYFPKTYQNVTIQGNIGVRLQKKHMWGNSIYREKSLNKVFDIITKNCEKGKLLKVISDGAKTLYKMFNDCKQQTGKNIITRATKRISIIAATVYKSCEINKLPKTAKEIAILFDIAKKKLTKGITVLETILKLNSDTNSQLQIDWSSITAEDCIRAFYKELGIKDIESVELAITITKNCSRLKQTSGHDSRSVAATALVIMTEYTDEDICRKKISKCLHTSDVTINKIYNKISYLSEALIDDDLTTYLMKIYKIKEKEYYL
jgi:transcription initiation factor TFIIB